MSPVAGRATPGAPTPDPDPHAPPASSTLAEHVHGSSSYWHDHGCRHPACVAASSAARAETRGKQWTKRYKIATGPGPKDFYWFNPAAPVHGTSNGYAGYGCRCPVVPGTRRKPGCGPVGRAAARAYRDERKKRDPK